MSGEHSIASKGLEDSLNARQSNEFPGANGAGYKARYVELSGYLKKNVHSEVGIASALASIQAGGEPVYLTDHGKEHIEKVIVRATDIVRECDIVLTGYEEYLLLLAIHFHDVGNYYGRDKHEEASNKVMSHLGTRAGDDKPEKRMILHIAAAHGGSSNGDKDKIGKLDVSSDLLCHKVRPRMLAAIVRFADELADDSTRASSFGLSQGSVPPASELFHRYAQALQSVVVDEGGIRLKFEFDKPNALKKFKKGDADVFLLDEIFARLTKMHCERIYCMRFLGSPKRIERIAADISVFQDFRADTFTTEPIKRYQFQLVESGYPDCGQLQIVDLCPSIKGVSGQTLSEELRTPVEDELDA